MTSYATKIMSCNINPLNTSKGEYTVNGKIDAPNGTKLVYWAPSPPGFITSFAGSGLPYPSPEVAYENTPNLGSTIVNNKSYSFKLFFPNSFYTELGTIYNEPQVHIKLCSNNNEIYDVKTISLKNPIPYRSLSYGSDLNIPRTAGTCSETSNKDLTCSTYGVCQNTPQTPQQEGMVINTGGMPFFYTNFYQQQPNQLRSQQQILWESKYPDNMKWYPNFWGNKPPQ